MDALDFYALLEIPQDADLTQIKNAYKRKAFELHPDKNLGKKTATQEFQVVCIWCLHSHLLTNSDDDTNSCSLSEIH